MNKILIILLLLTSLWSARAFADAAYLSLAGDVPLAPGLSEQAELAVIFDKPEGRIIRMVAHIRVVAQAQASPDSSSARIADFYRTTLPNLGWQRAHREHLHFTRANETLHITLDAHRAVFEIAPISVP